MSNAGPTLGHNTDEVPKTKNIDMSDVTTGLNAVTVGGKPIIAARNFYDNYQFLWIRNPTYMYECQKDCVVTPTEMEFRM